MKKERHENTVAHMERDSIEELISYDTDFDRVPGIVRLEP